VTVTPEAAGPPSHAALSAGAMLRRDPAEALAQADSSPVDPANTNYQFPTSNGAWDLGIGIWDFWKSRDLKVSLITLRDATQRALHDESADPAPHFQTILYRVPEMEPNVDPGEPILGSGVSETGECAHGVVCSG
jgi:hypothetical protein